MAWMTTLLLARCEVVAAIERALGELIGDSARRSDADGLLGPPPPLTISPARGGWTAVCGCHGWFSDLVETAAALSERCDTTVLGCELLGNSYRLRLSEHRSGQQRHLLQTPDLPWGAEVEHRGRMPLYEDVEQRAFSVLGSMGVPPELLLISTEPLGARGSRDLGQGRQLWLDDQQRLATGRIELATPALQTGEEAPVIVADVSRSHGLTLMEHRYVEGAPTDAAIDRLIALEEALAARARRAADVDRVNLTVTYHAGSQQPAVDEMLRARQRHVAPDPRAPRAPWWQFWRYFGFGWKKRRD